MFQTVRHWWGSGRGKMTARLFLFEFVVVVAGVLVAQGLANWVQDRADRDHMRDERARARQELSQFGYSALAWKAAAPCLAERVATIMSGQVRAGKDLQRPSLTTLNYTPPDEHSLLLIGKTYGAEERDLYKMLASDLGNMKARGASLIAAWSRFALLDPANGPIGPSDFVQVRIAGADILGTIHGETLIADNVLQRVRTLGIEPRSADPAYAPARTCDSIWRSGRIEPPIERR
ncbi:hypothetical protein H8M03_08865 [Sphingomonas sabuli]|uniref:Uncharacterized protein n=1 Tax=Sphingomonas sabuli TaxID=2764186 RepID=A0A7G9L0I6_9SPHN|nr:hypothetical protein [Sphingomonas sabuli]QNM82135.1 hypothetical protein H8M03_08865 [Sphingomonas sabuli]